MSDEKRTKYKILLKILVLGFSVSLLYALISYQNSKQIEFKGFGWYGYLADDRLNETSLKKIEDLGGNIVNINVYYEYDLKNESFILKSNLTRVKDNIDLVHQKGMKVFLSPFANLLGGHYLANTIDKGVDKYLDGAKNISVELANFSNDNDVEIYAIWNEMGLSLLRVPNSTDILNRWIQSTRTEVSKIYSGKITTKEGVQLGLYRDYNYSEFDYIGVTFYPFTTSKYTDYYSGMTYSGVENLDEYEKVIKEEYEHLVELEQKFKVHGIILGEAGIDVVGGKYIDNDTESKSIRVKAYDILLSGGKGKIDGFFFNRFEYFDGGSKELDELFDSYFRQ